MEKNSMGTTYGRRGYGLDTMLRYAVTAPRRGACTFRLFFEWREDMDTNFSLYPWVCLDGKDRLPLKKSHGYNVWA